MKSGRGEALSALFDRYFRLVLCVALRILRDAGEAEDLMQDVFLEIYKRACLFDASKGSAKTWILQYAYHRSMNRRQYLIARRFYKSEEISALELGRWEPSYSPNGWDGLTCEERKRMLKKGMESLGDKQKRVLELAYSEGLLIKELAEYQDMVFTQFPLTGFDRTGEAVGAQVAEAAHDYKNRFMARAKAEGIPLSIVEEASKKTFWAALGAKQAWSPLYACAAVLVLSLFSGFVAYRLHAARTREFAQSGEKQDLQDQISALRIRNSELDGRVSELSKISGQTT